MATAANDEQHVEQENHQSECSGIENGEMITRGVKSAVKVLVANELSTIEESLEDVLQTLFYNTRSGIRSVLYFNVQQVMVGLLRNNVIFTVVGLLYPDTIGHWCSCRWIIEEIVDLKLAHGDCCDSHETQKQIPSWIKRNAVPMQRQNNRSLL